MSYPIPRSSTLLWTCYPVHASRQENPEPGPMFREWEEPIQTSPSGFRDPVQKIAAWLVRQDVGKSFTASGVNLTRLKLAAESANLQLGYTAFSISKSHVTRKARQ